jgi:hypothetical protein
MATAVRERYATAVHSSDLSVEERSKSSDSDVLGAMGIAARRMEEGYVVTGPGKGYDIRPTPMAAPLERLFAGDDRAGPEIIAILAKEAFDQSWKIKLRISRADVADMASICLRWHRDGACPACGGHGYDLIPNTPTLSDRACKPCKGAGKVVIEDVVDPDGTHPGRRDLVRWMIGEMERSSAVAFSMAAQALAPRLDL